MTLDQLIEQVRVERTKAAAQLSTLDAALAALTKATAVQPRLLVLVKVAYVDESGPPCWFCSEVRFQQ
jgi:hypothetical protein